jgi:putative cell wall-binding protein
MRALRNLRSWRPRLRSSFAAFAATLIFVATGVVGVLGFAGTANANPAETAGETPVMDIVTQAPNTIDNLGPFLDAIEAGTSGPAANWAFDLNDNPSTSVTLSSTWSAGDQIVIDVGPPGSPTNAPWTDQDVSTGDDVEFDGTPTVLVGKDGASGSTVPTFTVSPVSTDTAHDTANDIALGLTDQLVITFTDSATVTGLTPYTLIILGIQYTVGAGTPQGPITSAGFYLDTPNPGTAGHPGVPLAVIPNAAVIDLSATANVPPVTVLPSAVAAPISPISVNELKPGQVGADSNAGDEALTSVGYICVTIAPNASPGPLPEQATFVGSPTIGVSGTTVGGLGNVQGTVSIINSGTTLVTQVLVASSSPTTYTFSNLETNAPELAGQPEATGPVTAEVSIDQNFNCTGGEPVALPGSPTYDYSTTGVPEITIYTVGTGHGPKSNAPIYGSTSEQTAVAALEYELPPAPLGNCLPNNANPHPRATSFGSTVVLTVDSNDGFDSLSASYLASYYNTGVLLTGGGTDEADVDSTVDQYTMNAIQQEGATTVLIVGGVDAVSAADATELAATPSYECGGSVERTNSLGQPLDLQVQRIWGPTADATAAAVATFVNSGNVNDVDISGGFSGGYNDTLGTSSSASPNIPLRTAILSTDLDSQDAESASSLSYFENLPLLLTPQESLGSYAETALLDLGIQQVIELGGPLAIDAPVNTALESQGISVLRIAGQDGSETSVQLAKFELSTDTTSAGQPLGLGWGNEQADTLPGTSNCLSILDPGIASNPGSLYYSCDVTVAMARGDFFADGVTSSVVTGQQAYPILLTESPSSLGTYLTAFFEAGGSPAGVDPPTDTADPFVPFQGEIIDDIVPFGGPLALNLSTIQAALNAISAGANPPT